MLFNWGNKLSGSQIVIANLLSLLAAVVQGFFGMGGSLVTVPLMGLLNPILVPVPTLFTGLTRTIMILFRDHSGIERNGLTPILLGVIPGSFLGALAASRLSANGIVTIASILVLIGVVASIKGWRPRDSAVSRFSVGAGSGLMAAISSIAGPMVAVFYQDSKNLTIRATMSIFFIVTNITALVFLAILGKIHHLELIASLQIMPGMLIGHLISTKHLKTVDKRSIRPIILALATLSALIVIIQELHLY